MAEQNSNRSQTVVRPSENTGKLASHRVFGPGQLGPAVHLVMYRASSGSFLFGIWLVTACGPNDLEENRFPPLNESGYPDGRGSGGSPSTPSAVAGAGGTSMQGSAGTSNNPPSMGCPENITQLFDRTIDEGGCRGPGCHIPGNTRPDLVSPNPEERLLNVTSNCNGRPYIGDEDSFLVEKLTNDSPECGSPMPFLMPGNLSAEDEACILAWIEEVLGQ
jgi:hypothetical protein